MAPSFLNHTAGASPASKPRFLSFWPRALAESRRHIDGITVAITVHFPISPVAIPTRDIHANGMWPSSLPLLIAPGASQNLRLWHSLHLRKPQNSVTQLFDDATSVAMDASANPISQLSNRFRARSLPNDSYNATLPEMSAKMTVARTVMIFQVQINHDLQFNTATRFHAKI